MPYKILTEIDKPPSLYAKITKGTFLEPWMWRAYENYYYFNAPVNIWERDSGLFERITRAGHIGFCVGTVTGLAQGYFYNLSKGIKGHDMFKNKQVYKVAGLGMLTGLLQSTAFTITVSGLSAINGREDTPRDWYFGGLSMGLVTLAMSQTKNVVFSKKWNMMAIFAVPFFPALAKYLRFMNEYDDPKGGRYPGTAGGQQHHSLAEMRGLYGIEPHEAPLERVIIKNEHPDMLFMKPRQNPRWNDKFRVDAN